MSTAADPAGYMSIAVHQPHETGRTPLFFQGGGSVLLNIGGNPKPKYWCASKYSLSFSKPEILVATLNLNTGLLLNARSNPKPKYWYASK